MPAKKSSVIIAPSILSADPLNLLQDMTAMEKAGADWHHVDVMDGHFVPNLTFGLPLIRALKMKTKVPLDVHIMVSNPDVVAMDYVKAGASMLTFHVEATVHAHRLAQAIRDGGARPGISLNPGTPVENVFPLLSVVDMVLVMSVNPGFGGQAYIPQTPERVRRIAAEIERLGRKDKVIISIDGGMNDETAPLVAKAGARAFVAGSFLYTAKDRLSALQKLRAAAEKHTA